MRAEVVKISEVKVNPNNPRLIKDDKFAKLVQSIKDLPQMLAIRPIVVNADMIVLGGNMRLKACKEAGLKEVPIIIADNLTEDQQREFLIKDNVSGGEWDWNMIQSEWDTNELAEWGLDVVGFDLDSDALGTEFSLPDGDKAPFQQMTFTLADEQVQQIKNAIQDIKETEEYKYCETMGNENSNGNALYLIIMQWAEQKK
jgi:ParB-like chromosome segregation protein Spo0J